MIESLCRLGRLVYNSINYVDHHSTETTPKLIEHQQQQRRQQTYSNHQDQVRSDKTTESLVQCKIISSSATTKTTTTNMQPLVSSSCHHERLVSPLMLVPGCQWIKIVILLILISVRNAFVECSRDAATVGNPTSLLFTPIDSKSDDTSSRLEIVDHSQVHPLNLSLSSMMMTTNSSRSVPLSLVSLTPYGDYNNLFDLVVESGHSIELKRLLGQLSDQFDRQLMLMLLMLEGNTNSKQQHSSAPIQSPHLDGNQRVRIKRMAEEEVQVGGDLHSRAKYGKPKKQLNETHLQLQSADYNDNNDDNIDEQSASNGQQANKRASKSTARPINRAKQRRQTVTEQPKSTHSSTTPSSNHQQPQLVSTLSPVGLAAADDYQHQQDTTTNNPSHFDDNMPIPTQIDDDGGGGSSTLATSINSLNDDQLGSFLQPTTTATIKPNIEIEKPESHSRRQRQKMLNTSPSNHRATPQALNEQLDDNYNQLYANDASNRNNRGRSMVKTNSSDGIKRSVDLHETHDSYRNPPPPEQSPIFRANFDENSQLDQSTLYSDTQPKSLPQVGEQSVLEQANNDNGVSSSLLGADTQQQQQQQQQQIDDQQRLSQLIELSEGILKDKKMSQQQHDTNNHVHSNENNLANKLISYNDQLNQPNRGNNNLQTNSDNSFMPIHITQNTARPTAHYRRSANGKYKQRVSSNNQMLYTSPHHGATNHHSSLLQLLPADQKTTKLVDARNLLAENFFGGNHQYDDNDYVTKSNKSPTTTTAPGKTNLHQLTSPNDKLSNTKRLRASGSQTYANIISSTDTNLNNNLNNFQPTSEQVNGLLLNLQQQQQQSVNNGNYLNYLNLLRAGSQQQNLLSTGSTSPPPSFRLGGKTGTSVLGSSSSSSSQMSMAPIAAGTNSLHQQQPSVYLTYLNGQQQQPPPPMITTATLGTMLHPMITAAPTVQANNRLGSLKLSAGFNHQHNQGPMKRLMTSSSGSSGRLAKMTHSTGGGGGSSMFDEPSSSSIHPTSQGAASNDPIWSDTQTQEDDYQQAPQTIQITAVPNGLVGNGFGGGWNGWNGGWNGGLNGVNGWNGGVGGPWNGRQVLLVNRQPPGVVGASPDGSDWRSWALPIAIILALPLVLGALFVPLFLKSVMFLIQILQMLGLLMPPHQLANHLTGQVSGSLGSSG